MISWFSYLCSCLLSSILVCILIFGKIVLQTLIAKRAWKLSRMPFNWPPKGSLSFCPSSLSINPQHSSQRIPLKMSLRACLSCAKSLQWLRNKHQGLQDFTPTQPSLPLGCYFYISLLLPFFFFFWSLWTPWGSSTVPGTICFNAFGYSGYSAWNPALPWMCTLLAPFHYISA